jgi:CHAD domain-containing protein
LPNAVREFVLDDDATAPGDAILPAGDRRFAVTDGGRSRTLRRTWLDTFDWRLFRAGLTLELRSGAGARELVLTGRDGEVVASTPVGAAGRVAGRVSPPIRWPALVQALPIGPLREQLAPVAGVRALLPVARATSVLTERRAMNTDDKTVARLTIDRMAVTYPRPATTPARVAVTALRGYQAQAARLTDALLAAPGVSDALTTPLESALAASGRKPGDYSSKIGVQLTATMPAALALSAVLGRLFDTAEANVPGTIADIDTEFLHDLRIAIRRTRSVLKTAAKVLPAAMVSQYRPEFKWLGDLTTPTRDLDVYLFGYSSMAGKVLAATADELLPFHEYLQRQRGIAQRELARGLRSARFSRLSAQWRESLAQIAVAPQRRPQTGKLAAGQIARAHQRVICDGAAITAASAPQSLHDLRKRCKELRYLLEIFASLHDPADQWQAVNELKALQDCLGEFQDTEVQHAELRMFAAQMMADRSAPATTLLAMGEIAGTLAVRQRRARAEFAGRFAEFASPRGLARIHALTAVAA